MPIKFRVGLLIKLLMLRVKKEGKLTKIIIGIMKGLFLQVVVRKMLLRVMYGEINISGEMYVSWIRFFL